VLKQQVFLLPGEIEIEGSMLWFGVTIIDGDERSQEIHGPFEDVDSLTDAVDVFVEDAQYNGQKAIPMAFELSDDEDVPEVVEL
jgi:hypothetical protein